MTCLLTGGSGLLGRELLRIDPLIIAPSHAECDVGDFESVRIAVEKYRPSVIIHAAAATQTAYVNAHPEAAIRSNIIGTGNIALIALELGIRLIYLSSDYLYADTPGPHKEDEPLCPNNNYAWTKLGGECAVRLVPDSLIIRTSFGAWPCPYDRAAEDKLTSKQYVTEAAPQILRLARSDLTGIINLGGEPTTVFEYARRSNPDVRPVKLAELGDPIALDSTLDLSRWKSFLKK